MSDGPTSLVERRWDNNTGVDAHKPVDALRVTLAKMERGEIVADHVIIVVANQLNEGFEATFFQAGTLNSYAQVGLMHHAIKMMAED